MPLYGYKKDGNTTIVGAALNVQEFNDFLERATDLNTGVELSDMMMHLIDPEFQGFAASVAVIAHADAQQQDEFIEKYEILIGSRQRAVDRSIDMVNYDIPDPYDMDDSQTIEQMYGLDKEDRWDRRSDEEKELDAAMKEQIDQMRKKGELSNDDSFSAKKKENGVYVTDINVHANADGSFAGANVIAVKTGGGEAPAEEVAEDDSTNATLHMQFGDKALDVRVRWVKRNLFGSEELTKNLYEGTEYYAEWKADLEPVITVSSDDGKQQSVVKYSEMFDQLFSDVAFKS